MKRCPRCGFEKTPEEFGHSSSSKDGLQSYCKPCQRDYRQKRIDAGLYDSAAHSRTYYANNREDRIAAQIERKIQRKITLVLEAGGKCQKCGYAESLAALTFHHRDPATKEYDIAVKLASYGIDRLRLEAAKCDLLCFNCHMQLEFPFLRHPISEATGEYIA